MTQKIDTTLLDNWKNNLGDSTLPVKTKSVIVDLSILKNFIEEASKSTGFNAVRIYFIRYDESDGLSSGSPHIEKVAPGNLSQVSLAFVPVKNFSPKTLGGQDITEANKILTLAVCHPLDYDITDPAIAKGSGLCPPKCHT